MAELDFRPYDLTQMYAPLPNGQVVFIHNTEEWADDDTYSDLTYQGKTYRFVGGYNARRAAELLAQAVTPATGVFSGE